VNVSQEGVFGDISIEVTATWDEAEQIEPEFDE